MARGTVDHYLPFTQDFGRDHVGDRLSMSRFFQAGGWGVYCERKHVQRTPSAQTNRHPTWPWGAGPLRGTDSRVTALVAGKFLDVLARGHLHIKTGMRRAK